MWTQISVESNFISIEISMLESSLNLTRQCTFNTIKTNSLNLDI